MPSTLDGAPRCAKLSAFCLASAIVAGCATPPDRTYLDQQAQRVAGQPVALITDACVVRDAVGEDWVILDWSEQTGSTVLASLSRALQDQGVRPKQAVFASMCALGADIEDGLDIAVADSRDDARRPVDAFPLTVPNTQFSDAQRAAYTYLVTQTLEATRTVRNANKTWSSSGDTVTINLTDDMRASLREDLGTNLVWVSRVNNVDVSGFKSVGTALLTGVLTAVLTGGTAVSSSTVVDGQNVLVALIDLDADSIVWAKYATGVNGPADKPTSFDADWARATLDPFYPKTSKRR